MKGIRALTCLDCEEILRINSESLPGVAHLDRTELERLMAIPNEHLAMECPTGGLAGYMLAFRSDAPYDGEEFLTFAKASAKPFIYIDQVAVDTTTRRMGVATILYNAMAAHALGASLSALCCEVNLKPPNPISLAFHQNSGFNRAGVLDTEDGRTVALMKKTLKGGEPEARET
jgi:predicted GNAT superfamily acetyltransferase